MPYEKIIQMLSEESDKLKETHPRVRTGIVRAIMVIEEEREKTLFKAGERDWEEDFAGENGQYFCKCVECGEEFIGHKRRLVCKKCVKDEEERTIYTDRR